MDVELGTFKLTDAYEAAIRYPFRPGAARAVVGVIANPCEKSPFPISVSFYFLYKTFIFINIFLLYVIYIPLIILVSKDRLLVRIFQGLN